MHLFPHLRTGDYISYIIEPGLVSYGRIIQRVEGRIVVTRYVIREEGNYDDDDDDDEGGCPHR